MKSYIKEILSAVLIAALICAATALLWSWAPQPPQVAGTGTGLTPSTLAISNDTSADTVVYVAFGADSRVLPGNWPCVAQGPLRCDFPLKAHSAVSLPLSGSYLNATFSFGAPVGCGSTKAELNVNNPKWFDIADISLVDGFNVPVSVDVGGRTLAVAGVTGNESNYGVYPNGCDICVARQSPPCGMSPGVVGCHAANDMGQPVIPCQWQGAVKGGGNVNYVIHSNATLVDGGSQ